MNFREKMTGRDIAGVLLFGISLLMLGKSLTLCFSNDIWYDELFTVGLIGHSYGELVRFTAADVHPPLYYCIVKLWVELCKLIVPEAETVMLAKLASVLPYVILMVYSATLVRRRFGALAAGLFPFCILAMPQLSAYTVEVRMYGWAMLFVTAAFLHAWELILCYGNDKTACGEHGKSPSEEEDCGGRGAAERSGGGLCHAAALVLYGLAAAYTQYFACVAVGMVYFGVLIVLIRYKRRKIRTWLLCAALSAVGYVPWLATLAGQLHAVRENYWILPLTWRSLGGCVKFLMKPAFANDVLSTVWAVALTCGCGAAVLYVMLAGGKGKLCNKMTEKDKLCYNSRVLGTEMQRREKAEFAAAGVGVLAGLTAFGFAASFLFRPVFVYRYMIPAAGCFWLSVAVSIDELCKLKRRSVGVLLLALLIPAGMRDYRAFMGEEEYKIVCMKETQTALSQIGPGDSVLYNFDQVQAVTGYYLPETVERFLWRTEGETLIQEITSSCALLEETEEIEQLLSAARREKGERNIWFIGSFNSRDDIVAQWRDAGFTVEEQGNFLLERYWFNLYKIS